MGLIKALVGSTGSVLADQWRDYFYCDAMPADVLMCKGEKKVNRKRSSNTKGSDNVITNGSVILVNEGQCMLIVEQGKVVEFCAEPGEFTYDSSTEPTMLYGGLGQGIKDSFKTIGKRFTFGGDAAKDQRVYYINTKEILGNKFGTAAPVPFRVVDNNIGLDVDIAIRCNGEYSFRVVDPILFYTNVAGNVAGEYRVDNMSNQMRMELLTALQPAFAKISAMGIRYSALPGSTTELCEVLQSELSQKWTELRGLRIVSIGINSAKASEEDEAMIKDLQKSAVMRNPNMAAARLTEAQAEAMRAAAANESAGPMMAFAGMNMASQAGGINATTLFQMAGQNQMQQNPYMQQGQMPQNPYMNQGQMPQNQQMYQGQNQQMNPQMNQEQMPQDAQNQAGQQPNASGWYCPNCGTHNEGNFCFQCGTKKPF